jgi:antagonist of KipI
MSLHVLEPGLYTLIVDQGRPRSRSLGVPVGGAADRTSLALGNALVGNPPDAAALEISLAGPTLRADCELGCVVYGAPFVLTCGRRSLTAGKTFTLPAGEVLRIGGTPEGMRAYLCVKGGIETPLTLGSRSGLAPVPKGANLPCRPGAIAGRSAVLPDEFCSWGPERRMIRVIEGGQASWFPPDALGGATPFTVTPASNRMGLRLSGPPLAFPAEELVSEPVCPGAVQVTRDGQRIILGVDGQTIGGYPKLAQVIAADLDKLGQLRPGDTVVFQRVTLEEAENFYRERMKKLREWLLRLQTAELF